MCNSCSLDKPIVNKKHNLCDDCNFLRLHNGQTKAQVYSDRKVEKDQSKPFNWYDQKLPQSLLTKKPLVTKTKTRIKQQTTQQKDRQQQLHVVKSEITVDAQQDGQYYCQGCGVSGVNLDCSHILSVKHRKDLELDKLNINLFCRICHIGWESNDIITMLRLNSFEKDLQYIKIHDVGRYNKLLDAINYFIVHEQIFDSHLDENKKAYKISSENDFILIK